MFMVHKKCTNNPDLWFAERFNANIFLGSDCFAFTHCSLLHQKELINVLILK